MCRRVRLPNEQRFFLANVFRYLRNEVHVCYGPRLLVCLYRISFPISMYFHRYVQRVSTGPKGPIFRCRRLRVTLHLTSRTNVCNFTRSNMNASVCIILGACDNRSQYLYASSIFRSSDFRTLYRLNVRHYEGAARPCYRCPLRATFSLIFRPALRSLVLRPLSLS